MAIPLSCPCGATLKVDDRHAGGVVACPRCRARLQVPYREHAPLRVQLVDEEPAQAIRVRRFHPGTDLENADFFVPAPQEIGPLRTAHTSLRKTKRPRPFWLRLLIGVLLGLAAAGVPVVFIFQGVGFQLADFLTVLSLFFLVICPVSLGLTLYFTRFRHYCGYVGEHGLAYFACAGRRDRLRARDVFLFENAADLRVATTHHHVNGVYQNTTYVYTWSDERGRRVYVFSGSHRSHDRPPPPHDRYQLALAAEEGWSLYVLGQVLRAIHAGEAWTFRLRGKDHILLHGDGLELHLGRKVAHLSPEDLAEVRLEKGLIALEEPGAQKGWLSSTGIHHFSFADLANAQVFLLLLERLFGMPTR